LDSGNIKINTDDSLKNDTAWGPYRRRPKRFFMWEINDTRNGKCN